MIYNLVSFDIPGKQWCSSFGKYCVKKNNLFNAKNEKIDGFLKLYTFIIIKLISFYYYYYIYISKTMILKW